MPNEADTLGVLVGQMRPGEMVATLRELIQAAKANPAEKCSRAIVAGIARNHKVLEGKMEVTDVTKAP